VQNLGVAAGTVPLSVALVSGSLVALNPCSAPLLPSFFSYYAGADAGQLPRARTSVVQGLAAGALLVAGTVAVFAAVGFPLVYGATRVADAVPWSGLVAGVAAVVAGVVVLAGRTVSLPVRTPRQHVRRRRPLALLAFGVAYGVASLGCSLPIFLAFLAVSLASSGTAAALTIFGVYVAGMATTLLVLSLVAALLREGIGRRLGPVFAALVPLSGLLLVLAGGYLTYFWARVRFGDTATLADDPVVGFATRYTARVQTLAGRLGLTFVLALVLVLVLALVASLWHSRRTERS
jgi:cytochrome c biogenesis protein CcdA